MLLRTSPRRALPGLVLLAVLLLVTACDQMINFDVQVVDTQGKPVPGASVTMGATNGKKRVVTTNAGGRYAFSAVTGMTPGGWHETLEISKPGYKSVTGEVGARSTSSLVVTLAAEGDDQESTAVPAQLRVK